MNTVAVAEAVGEGGSVQPLVVAQSTPVAITAKKKTDEHGLVPVFAFGIIALALSTLMVGSILMMLALRHSGVMAP